MTPIELPSVLRCTCALTEAAGGGVGRGEAAVEWRAAGGGGCRGNFNKSISKLQEKQYI